MKKSLLLTTALVATISAVNAKAENLPADATNLTSDNYIVADNGEAQSHTGNVKLSEEASLTVNTFADVDEENDSTDISHAFVVNGNVTVGDAENEGGTLTVERTDDEKPFMIVNGNVEINSGATVNLNSSSDKASTIAANNITINDGTLNLNSGELATSGAINITGGNTTIHNGGMYTSGTDGINISGGKINITNLQSSGEDVLSNDDINITGGELTAQNTGIQAKKDINISNGTLKISKTNDDDVPSVLAFGDANISGGNISLTNADITSLGKIDVSGGNITLQGGNIEASLSSYGGNLTVSGADTVVNMKGRSLLTSIDDMQNGEDPSINNTTLSEATINVSGTGNIIGAEGTVAMNSGTLNIANGGALLIAKNANDEAGTLTFNGGDINLSGELTGNVNGAGNLNFKTTAGKITGDVTGSALNFETNNSLSSAVSGNVSNLKALNINKGTLIYDKDTGNITELNVAGQSGLNIGTNTVTAGTVNFADNSKLALHVASTEKFGNIQASTINIGDDTTMNVTLDNGVVKTGESSTIQLLDGTLNGDFTNKIAENNRYSFDWNDDGSLKITGTATAADVVNEAGGTQNNAATATAWDSMTSSTTAGATAKSVASTLNNLSQTNEQAYVEALTALAPEVAPAVQQTSTETANQVFGAVGTRLSGGSVSTGGEGMSSGDSVFERAAVWVQGLFNKSKLDDTHKAKGYDADTSGVAFGFEKNLTDSTKVGIGYAYSETDIDGFKRDTDVDTHTAILYGEYKPSNWYLNGIATYGWSDYDESKNVAGVKVNSSYDVETFGLQAMTGYDFHTPFATFTPETGLRYVHIKQDAYKDSAEQRISANNSDILTGVLGAKITKAWSLDNGIVLKPEAKAAMTYDFAHDAAGSVVTLANGSVYTVDGEALKRFGMEVGAGITTEFNDDVELSLGYEGKFRDHYEDHTGLLNAKYKF